LGKDKVVKVDSLVSLEKKYKFWLGKFYDTQKRWYRINDKIL
jgi:hypothetical protein